MLNVITKSGSNSLTARGYGFVRDDNFDTAPYAGRFVNGEPQFLSEPPQFNQLRIGGYVGGPIKRDSLSAVSTKTSRTTLQPSSPFPTTGATGDWRR